MLLLTLIREESRAAANWQLKSASLMEAAKLWRSPQRKQCPDFAHSTVSHSLIAIRSSRPVFSTSFVTERALIAGSAVSSIAALTQCC